MNSFRQRGKLSVLTDMIGFFLSWVGRWRRWRKVEGGVEHVLYNCRMHKIYCLYTSLAQNAFCIGQKCQYSFQSEETLLGGEFGFYDLKIFWKTSLLGRSSFFIIYHQSFYPSNNQLSFVYFIGQRFTIFLMNCQNMGILARYEYLSL